MTQTRKPTVSSSDAYETCRRCGCAPCECKKISESTVGFDGLAHGTDLPRIRWIDWIEYVAVMALVWLAIVRPPLPGLDSGGCGTA